jgi:hypothetical protein
MSTEIIAVPGLASFPLIVYLHDNAIALAMVKAAHLLGVALLIGPVILFDLRVLGAFSHLSVRALARATLPVAVTSLALIVPSGLAMFAVHSDNLLTNQTFALKMGLVLVGGILAVVFHSGPYRHIRDEVGPTPIWARVLCASSMLGWTAVVVLATTMRG